MSTEHEYLSTKLDIAGWSRVHLTLFEKGGHLKNPTVPFTMDRTIIAEPGVGMPSKAAVGAELNAELSTLLRSGRMSFQNVQTGLNKVLTLEPLTSVKDLIIVGDGPAAEEIFQYCEDETVRGYRFCGVFNDTPIDGPLNARRIGDVEAAKAYAIQNRIDIVYCALPGTRRSDITELMEFCERNTIRFRVIPSADSFIPVVKTSGLEFHGAVPVSMTRQEPLDSASSRRISALLTWPSPWGHPVHLHLAVPHPGFAGQIFQSRTVFFSRSVWARTTSSSSAGSSAACA